MLKAVLIYISSCLALLLVFSFFSIISYIISRKKKNIIENIAKSIDLSKKKIGLSITLYIISFFILMPLIISLYLIVIAFFALISAFNFFSLLFSLYLIYGIIISFYHYFKKTKDIETTYEATRENDFGIWKINDYICNKLNVESVDSIIIHPNTEFSVEIKKDKGKTKKILNVGLATILGLEQKHLLSILAHEYGHYYYPFMKNSMILYRIDRFFFIYFSLQKTSMASSIANLSYWILKYYYFIFKLLTANYSRYNEYLADYVSITNFGSINFMEALQKYIMLGIKFETALNNSCSSFRDEIIQKNIRSPYSKYFLSSELDNREKDIYQSIITKKKKFFDTHPSLEEREHFSLMLNQNYKEDSPSFDINTNEPEKYFIDYYKAIIKNSI